MFKLKNTYTNKFKILHKTFLTLVITAFTHLTPIYTKTPLQEIYDNYELLIEETRDEIIERSQLIEKYTELQAKGKILQQHKKDHSNFIENELHYFYILVMLHKEVHKDYGYKGNYKNTLKEYEEAVSIIQAKDSPVITYITKLQQNIELYRNANKYFTKAIQNLVNKDQELKKQWKSYQEYFENLKLKQNQLQQQIKEKVQSYDPYNNDYNAQIKNHMKDKLLVQLINSIERFITIVKGINETKNFDLKDLNHQIEIIENNWQDHFITPAKNTREFEQKFIKYRENIYSGEGIYMVKNGRKEFVEAIKSMIEGKIKIFKGIVQRLTPCKPIDIQEEEKTFQNLQKKYQQDLTNLQKTDEEKVEAWKENYDKFLNVTESLGKFYNDYNLFDKLDKLKQQMLQGGEVYDDSFYDKLDPLRVEVDGFINVLLNKIDREQRLEKEKNRTEEQKKKRLLYGLPDKTESQFPLFKRNHNNLLQFLKDFNKDGNENNGGYTSLNDKDDTKLQFEEETTFEETRGGDSDSDSYLKQTNLDNETLEFSVQFGTMTIGSDTLKQSVTQETKVGQLKDLLEEITKIKKQNQKLEMGARYGGFCDMEDDYSLGNYGIHERSEIRLTNTSETNPFDFLDENNHETNLENKPLEFSVQLNGEELDLSEYTIDQKTTVGELKDLLEEVTDIEKENQKLELWYSYGGYGELYNDELSLGDYGSRLKKSYTIRLTDTSETNSFGTSGENNYEKNKNVQETTIDNQVSDNHNDNLLQTGGEGGEDTGDTIRGPEPNNTSNTNNPTSPSESSSSNNNGNKTNLSQTTQDGGDSNKDNGPLQTGIGSGNTKPDTNDISNTDSSNSSSDSSDNHDESFFGGKNGALKVGGIVLVVGSVGLFIAYRASKKSKTTPKKPEAV